MKLPELNEVLQYRNEELLARYRRDYPNNKLAAEKALEEIIKFLWLGQKHRKDQLEQPDNENLQFPFLLHVEMTEIDDMWHSFLLFTKDYTDFCHQYFGGFIHHTPTTEAEKAKRRNNQQEIDKFINQDTNRQLSYVYDHLGEETLRLWFAEHFTETV